jgi:cytochrome b561
MMAMIPAGMYFHQLVHQAEMVMAGEVMVDDLVAFFSWIDTVAVMHKSIGLTIMLLAAARLVWRAINPVPPLPNNLKWWERIVAHATHHGLYLLMFLMPLTGWLGSAAEGIPGSFYFLFPIPAPVPANDTLAAILIGAHNVLSKLLIPAIVLHVSAAMKHLVVLRDGVMRRMLPGVGPRG